MSELRPAGSTGPMSSLVLETVNAAARPRSLARNLILVASYFAILGLIAVAYA